MQSKDNANEIVFFDGECVLCNRAAYLLLKMDRKGKLKYTSLQSEFAKKILNREPGRVFEEDTILFLSKGRFFSKSEALLHITASLGFPYSFLAGFRLIPRSWRDKLYDYIARNRQAWFGKTHTCIIAGPGYKKRFLP